jgi:hypothetical protein
VFGKLPHLISEIPWTPDIGSTEDEGLGTGEYRSDKAAAEVFRNLYAENEEILK